MRWSADLRPASEAVVGRYMTGVAWRIVRNEAVRDRISVLPLRTLSKTFACPED
jgi:hypothetical protein